MEAHLKATFKEVKFVATAADLWTADKRAFMGVTCHWVDRATLDRKKAANVACKRGKGKHTYDMIAEHLEQIHSSYGLTGKVVATVTDNGSNFVQAFRVYQTTDLEDGQEDEMPAEDEVIFADLSEILAQPTGEEQYTLPPHYKCASHTCNLISTTDVTTTSTPVQARFCIGPVPQNVLLCGQRLVVPPMHQNK